MAGNQGGMNGSSTERQAEAAAAVASSFSEPEGKDSVFPEPATGVSSDGGNRVDAAALATDDEAPRNYRMSDALVQQILAHKRTPFVIPDGITHPEARRLLLEVAAEHEELEDRYPAFQARIRQEYEANGFVALPDDFKEMMGEIDAAAGEVDWGDESDEEDYYTEEELAAMLMRQRQSMALAGMIVEPLRC
ncbi:hypothetical protein BRADI_4g16193v3 [Brachypodium distachyon]|uniref:Uncharacterized protein n=1 Tax=Brachypodium distachyon TaxID=15368 RepID=A0A2K2CN55_BRADI|nr:hypothetical protein BRADI_4g16193v3 [Brachypodium distachyon]